jgi:hypothetical protein
LKPLSKARKIQFTKRRIRQIRDRAEKAPITMFNTLLPWEASEKWIDFVLARRWPEKDCGV